MQQITVNTKTRISNDKIEQLLQHNFGNDCILVDAVELTEGMYNAIYDITYSNAGDVTNVILKLGVTRDKFVLTYEQDIMATEVASYKLLDKIAIPHPKVLASDFSMSIIDCPYFFMEKLYGTQWSKLADSLTSDNKAKLEKALGSYVGRLHSIKADKFGYHNYQQNSWYDAFITMLDMALRDAKTLNVLDNTDEIMAVAKLARPYLEKVTTATFVNFDITGKNILLVKDGEEYVIEGFIDFERAFFGDAYADFLSLSNIIGDVTKATDFIEGYAAETGKQFVFDEIDDLRAQLYRIYTGVLQCCETYRFDENIRPHVLAYGKNKVNSALETLTQHLK